MTTMISKFCGFTLLVFSSLCLAVPEIKVNALFANKAMVTVDGKWQKLEAGKSVNGITLIEATSKQAVIKIDGEKQLLKLGLSSTPFMSATKTDVAPLKIDTVKTEEKREVLTPNKEKKGKAVIALNKQGTRFATQVSINGSQPLRGVIDTGAFGVVLTRKAANEIAAVYQIDRSGDSETANGKVKLHTTHFSSVKVGDVELFDVLGGVIEGSTDNGEDVLIGMAFLNRLKVTQDANKITLQTNDFHE